MTNNKMSNPSINVDVNDNEESSSRRSCNRMDSNNKIVEQRQVQQVEADEVEKAVEQQQHEQQREYNEYKHNTQQEYQDQLQLQQNFIQAIYNHDSVYIDEYIRNGGNVNCIIEVEEDVERHDDNGQKYIIKVMIQYSALMIAIKQLQKYRYDDHNNNDDDITITNHTTSRNNNNITSNNTSTINRILTNMNNQVDEQQLQEEVHLLGIISILIQCPSCDINYQNDYYHYTALHYSCEQTNRFKHLPIDLLIQRNPLLIQCIATADTTPAPTTTIKTTKITSNGGLGNGRTPLHILSLRQHKTNKSSLFPNDYIMKRYFHGSYPNIRDNNGQTPLHLLCISDPITIDHNNTNNDEDDEYFYMVRTSEMNMIEFMIERGCNVNEQDNDGQTPLHLAIQYYDGSSTLIIEYLINDGHANYYTIYNHKQQSPWDIAIQYNYTSIIDLLNEIHTQIRRHIYSFLRTVWSSKNEDIN